MILRDPVHGLVAFEAEQFRLIPELLETREVQRLRRRGVFILVNPRLVRSQQPERLFTRPLPSQQIGRELIAKTTQRPRRDVARLHRAPAARQEDRRLTGARLGQVLRSALDPQPARRLAPGQDPRPLVSALTGAPVSSGPAVPVSELLHDVPVNLLVTAYPQEPAP